MNVDAFTVCVGYVTRVPPRIRPGADLMGLPSAVTSAVQVPLYALMRSMYACTTPLQVILPSWIAFWVLAMVDSSTLNVPCADTSADASSNSRPPAITIGETAVLEETATLEEASFLFM